MLPSRHWDGILQHLPRQNVPFWSPRSGFHHVVFPAASQPCHGRGGISEETWVTEAARGAGLRSRCPVSRAEEFTALLMLTLYFSPQLLLCGHVSLLCCVSQRPGTQTESAFQCLAPRCYSEFPTPEPGEYFPSLAGCQGPGCGCSGGLCRGRCERLPPVPGGAGPAAAQARPRAGGAGSPSASARPLRQYAFLHCS